MPEPLSADDRLQLFDLLARYAHAQDTGGPEDFLACFAPGAELDTGEKQIKGDAALRDFADYYAKKPGRPWQHHITTIAIEGDGARARIRSYLMLIARDEKGASVLTGHATYVDECVKLDGRWLLAQHTVIVA